MNLFGRFWIPWTLFPKASRRTMPLWRSYEPSEKENLLREQSRYRDSGPGTHPSGLRIIYGAPALPADLPEPIKLAANLSQYIFYALMIGMPLIGWGMLSAASYPVVLFGSVHLPSILPVSPSLHTLLWHAHYCLAFAFFAFILMHVAAILFHKLIRNDGVFEAMAPVLTRNEPK